MAKGSSTSPAPRTGGKSTTKPLKVDQPKAPMKPQKKVNSNTSGK